MAHPGRLNVLWRRARPAPEQRLHLRFEQEALVHIDALYRTALRLANNREHAEDLVQETYLRAYRAFDRFDGQHCRAWLLTILRHTFISQLRHNGQSPPTIMFDDDPQTESMQWMPAGASAEDVVLAGLLGEELEQALARLPEPARLILLLAYVEELSYAEIAQVMDCPLGTVMSRLHRARRMLGAQLAGAVLSQEGHAASAG
jgi:RNA polymerase sigma-70 factor (ECF subfamily)